LKIDAETFEPVERREDYMSVCVEVVKANVTLSGRAFCKSGNELRRYSETSKRKALDEDLLVYFRLCKAGYASSVKEASEMDARTVIQALHYEGFCNDWEQAFLEIQ